jgi:hypothetical protein
MPHNTITSIDHPLIAVASLEQSHATYARLGFTVPPRGSQVEWGTGNWCIMFADDYLELRGIIDPARFTVGLDAELAAHGEGLLGLAFGTTGADAAYEQMLAIGMQPQPVRALARNFELPGGWVQPRFRLCFPAADDVLGLMHVVLCEHLTPELLRRPEFLEHPNGALGVSRMIGVIDDVDRVQAVQQRLLGADAVRRDGDGLQLELPSGQRIELLAWDAFAARFGRFWPDRERARHRMPLLGLRVDQLDETARCLERNRVPFVEHEGALLVAPDHTCGLLMRFEAPSG